MRTRGKENFTELFLNNLKFEDKFYEIGDAKTPALFIRVNQRKKHFSQGSALKKISDIWFWATSRHYP